jgi:hypothetical protein
MKRKKRLICLQIHPYRYRLTGIILPVRKYLQVSTCRRVVQKACSLH